MTGEKPTVEYTSMSNVESIRFNIKNTLELQLGYSWNKTLEKVKAQFDLLFSV